MRMRAIAGSTVLTLGAVALAADPVALRALFPREADVFVEKAGLARLDLPPEVVAACRADLSDLRLFDADGNEMPFLIDAPRAPAVSEADVYAPRVAEAARHEEPRPGGPSRRTETFTLDGPAKPPRFGSWILVVESGSREFVAKARIVRRPAAEAAPESIETSLFRLVSPRAAEKTRVPLGPGPAVRVELTLEHEGHDWLQPSFRFESARAFEAGGRNVVPLTIAGTSHADGRTTVTLVRPSGVVPESLRLASTTPTFDRPVTVTDEGPRRDAAPLGSGSVFRLLPDSGVETLEIALRPARGEALRVVVEDGDSPPLADLVFTAVFARPSLVASFAAGGGEAPAGVLRFGGGRARVPRYDLAGLKPRPGNEVFGERAEALLRIYEPGGTAAARLGVVRPNPAFESAPALTFAMHAGAPIDPGAFKKRRGLEVVPSSEGLARLRLGPDDLAVLRPDLADLRIADSEKRQWPYLVDRNATEVDVPLQLAETKTASRRSTYGMTTPIGPAVFTRLTLDPDAPFFDRTFRLEGIREGGDRVALAEGRLARAGSERTPVVLGLAPERVVRMELSIQDGDDAPLVLRGATARAPVADVYVAAPAGRYALLLGASDVGAPAYEIERAREVVLSVDAGAVRPGPLEANPDYRAISKLARSAGREQVLLWAALIGAVVVLAVLTLRLARR